MIKILFVCHGNICRSPMAEFIFKAMVKRAGLQDRVRVASAATSTEEIGNPIYPPVMKLLRDAGLGGEEKRARQVKKTEYDEWDYIIGMDSWNMSNLARIFANGDPEGKCTRLMTFAGRDEDVEDPWYTGLFGDVYEQIRQGCEGLLQVIEEQLA